jgi:COMPASS component SWD1
VSLYCLNCHPTRPFIAVGSSDGMIDCWGYRADWISYAPDFQALQQNVLYEEKEDEFDIVVDGDEGGGDNAADKVESPEDEDVDIITKMESPITNGSRQQFYFNARVVKMLKDKPTKKADHD